jgi:hypothetical protein
MRREEVRYLKGYPPLALQFPTEGPYNDRSDYKTWVYPVGDDPNTELTVTFNDDKTALIKISCTSHVAANQTVPSPVKQCPPLAGIVDGDSEKDVLDRLGPPDDVRFGAGAKLMAYQTRGLFFYLQRQQVYIMELSATK